MKQICPLCRSVSSDKLVSVKELEYFLCSVCKLIFLHPEFHLSQGAEREHYNTHENDPKDEGYRKFLQRLTLPLDQFLKPNSRGLDFGCGPGPTVSVLLGESGHEVANYDPNFAPDRSVLVAEYDFIVATEVFEHLRDPKGELECLSRILRREGILAIMTRFYPTITEFPQWFYRRDPTHICFYSPETFAFIGDQFGYKVEKFIEPDIVFLRKT